jgi:phosphatidylglycerol phospholipase C
VRPAPSILQLLLNITASFTSALVSQGRRRPQAIAHRGYKDAFPENTMGAFRGAVEAGSNAIETDIHLSKDGVVVISHVCPYLRFG